MSLRVTCLIRSESCEVVCAPGISTKEVKLIRSV